MAMASELLKEEEHRSETIDLTVCGICLSLIDDPKALPCLHTFCCGCLVEWTKEHSDKVKCPVCKEDVALPPEGVSGLRSNFFVTTLKEKEALQSTLMKDKLCCTCCEDSDNAAIAWCSDCKENLCGSCVKSHKTLKPLKGHKVYYLDDIRSDKVDIKKASTKLFCKKHEDQVPRFFCETCGVLICRDCTVVDHPVTKHVLVNVEEIAGEQRKTVEDLATRCQEVASAVEEAVKVAHTVKEDLDDALKKAHEDVDLLAQQVKEQFLVKLEKRRQEVSDEIDKIAHQAYAKLDQETNDFDKQRIQLDRALTFVKSMSENGSPYDLASMYTTLTGTLKKLSDLKPGVVSEDYSKVKCVASADYAIEVPPFAHATHLKPMSSLRSPKYHDLGGEWKLEKKIGKDCFANAMGMAVYPSTGNFAVACSNEKDQVKIFDSDGQFTQKIDVTGGSVIFKPRGVVITDDSSLIVTDKSQFLKIFDVNFKLIQKFQTLPPESSTAVTIWNSSLAGLAMDRNGRLIVGEINKRFISIHERSGEHINSFSMSITPWFISVSPSEDVIIVSEVKSGPMILDYNGQILRTLSSQLQNPTGSYFNGANEFIIASQKGSGTAGIHRYGTDGKYLGCITKEVDKPTGVLVTGDGKLWVLEWRHIKVFTKQ